jgi:hypothetical protein
MQSTKDTRTTCAAAPQPPANTETYPSNKMLNLQLFMQTNAHDTFKEINAPHGVIVSVSFSTIILSLLITCKAA